MRYSATLLVAAILFSGCATTQSIPVENRSRTYSASEDEAITAVVDAATEEGYPIETIDRQTGMVVTGRKSNSTVAAAFVGNQSRKLQAQVDSVGSGSRVVLTLVYESENAFGQSSAQSVGKSAAVDMYDEWFALIEKQLEQ